MKSISRILSISGAVLFLTLALTVPSGATSIISNGSFENSSNAGGFSYLTLYAGNTSITGWTVIDYAGDNLPGSIDYIQSYWQAADGRFSLDLNGFNAGGIQQTFATIPNQAYKVTFAMAGNPDAGPTLKTMIVDPFGLDLTFSFNTAGASHSQMHWQDYSFTFVASGALTTLQFVSQVVSGGTTSYPAAFGPALDNVRVDPIPEPSSLLLMGSGMIGAVIMIRRRK